MLQSRFLFIVIICMPIFSFVISSYAGDEIEDLIDIAESNSKIIAIIEGKKKVTYNLRPNEKVLWSGSRGHLGVFDRSAVLRNFHLTKFLAYLAFEVKRIRKSNGVHIALHCLAGNRRPCYWI